MTQKRFSSLAAKRAGEGESPAREVGAWRTDANLYHQWEEAETRAEKWEKKAKEEKENRKREVSDIVAKFEAEMAEMRGELKGEIGRLEKRVGELEEENEALKEDNERLKSIINKNSNNSGSMQNLVCFRIPDIGFS